MATKIDPSALLMHPIFHLGRGVLADNVRKIHRLVIKCLVYSLACSAPLGLAVFLGGFYWPTNSTFSTASENCITSLSLFPSYRQEHSDEQFSTNAIPALSIGNFPIISTKTCISPNSIVNENSVYNLKIRQFGLPMPKDIKIQTANHPIAEPSLTPTGLLSNKANMIFNLDFANHYYDYRLHVDGQSLDCSTQATTVSCPIEKLGLLQGSNYDFKLMMALGDSEKEIHQATYQTTEPVAITTSSISDNQVVYAKLESIEIGTSKSIKSASGISLIDSDNQSNININWSIQDNKIIIKWDGLSRQKNYSLTIKSINANDGGYLDAPYQLDFYLSGGPKITSTSLGSYKTSTRPIFSLYTDQNIKSGQNISDYISLEVSGKSIPFGASYAGTEIFIETLEHLGGCTNFNIKIKPGVVGENEVVSESEYLFESRTICQQVFSIGNSAHGRSISAYSFGSGSETILFIGSIHGDERSPNFLLSSLINHLESSPWSIPAHRRVIIVPIANPDGYGDYTRVNGNSVDLNRNFPASNWKSSVKMPGGYTLENGGGTAPLSEPESNALAGYIQAVNPKLVMSYHSQGSIVMGNDTGNSNSLASMYASYVDYTYVPTSESANTFEHDTTGALEDWLYEVPRIPCVLIEMSTHTTSGAFPYHITPILKIIQD